MVERISKCNRVKFSIKIVSNGLQWSQHIHILFRRVLAHKHTYTANPLYPEFILPISKCQPSGVFLYNFFFLPCTHSYPLLIQKVCDVPRQLLAVCVTLPWMVLLLLFPLLLLLLLILSLVCCSNS